jgi:hypothetical protein
MMLEDYISAQGRKNVSKASEHLQTLADSL